MAPTHTALSGKALAEAYAIVSANPDLPLEVFDDLSKIVFPKDTKPESIVGMFHREKNIVFFGEAGRPGHEDVGLTTPKEFQDTDKVDVISVEIE